MVDRLPARLVLKLTCPDQRGILARLAPLLAEHGCDIREASVYGDPQSAMFFVRMELVSPDRTLRQLEEVVRPLADAMARTWSLHTLGRRMRVLVAVSKAGHCLNDLLHKWQIGTLPIDIVGVVSNHPTLARTAEWHGLPFHHLPITPDTKPAQEQAFRGVIEDSGADLVVLARYMQVLSDGMSAWLGGRCINIHHSFLPSFKGAKPYHQAHARGVKLIGATAHYVTADLDEGPIIEQDVRRVTHATTVDDMIAMGREVEASVLSRAVRWHAEHRVFMTNGRTVVLRS
ncbi:formyltetrahydrofolate deformylase [Rhodothalassium salexigens]|uniref:formyltetrahydrofolate deformylase n=1 Tax=Rhodothalassium salexigens TaxID=1086 RepID=UPI001912DB23|nr:formyltetrahydrofolate deformylase [Rhodothalassium salexigens]MBK5919649.1 formyltetrahydrofolate deformylase [Rhodothalassium salexigens]